MTRSFFTASVIGLAAVLFTLSLPAAVTAQSLSWIDEAGQDADTYLERTRAFVRLDDNTANIDPGSAETVQVSLSSQLAGDAETLTLLETGLDSGVFEGSLLLDSSIQVFGNGFLETTQSEGPPLVFDTITATFGALSDTASTLGATLELIDAFGRSASTYATGSIVYLRVEDHEASGYAAVNLVAPSGDFELVFLSEISIQSGIHEGSIELQDSASFVESDGFLQAQAGDQIDASYFEVFGFSVPAASATLVAGQLDFVDAAGVPTQEILEAGDARLQLFAVGENIDPGIAETVTANLTSAVAGDSESLVLTETDVDTNTFAGSIPMETAFPGVGNGILETNNTGAPSFDFDQLDATAGGFTAMATTVGARVHFIDAFGREAAAYPVGDRVTLRVFDNNVNSPTFSDSVSATVSALASGDSELILLQETGLDTGVYEGSVALGPGSNPDDGLLDAGLGETIEATYLFFNTPGNASDQAQVSGSATFFVDASGQLASVYLYGELARVRVIDNGANTSSVTVDATSATLTSELSADLETISLTETGVDTGVFEGTTLIQLGFGQHGNGILETVSFSPDQDTLTATHTDGFGQSSATVQTLGSRIAFVDAAGNEVTTYPTGGVAFVRVEEATANNPANLDFVYVSLFSDVGDNLDIVLQETGKNTGVFLSSFDLADSAFADAFNGLLEAEVGNEITASHTEVSGGSSFTSATITASAIEIVDAAGVPVSELLENTTVRVRVTSSADNSDAFTAENLSVTLDSLRGADDESLVLTETGADTSVFEGEMVLLFIDPFSGIANLGDGVLETSNSGSPAGLPDHVTARFGAVSVAATTIGVRIAFIDAFGRETESFAAGGLVYVRVESHSFNDPLAVDTIDALVKPLSGNDLEQVLLTETSFDSSIFEGSVALGPGGNQFDGLLDAGAGEVIEVERYSPTGTTPPAIDRATIGGSATFFIDAEGDLAEEYLQASPAFVRVIDTAANANSASVEQTSVQVVSEVTGDVESVTLTETTADSGVFEGQVVIQFGTAQAGSGYLDVGEDFSAIDSRDTIVATYTDGFGQSSATARTVGSRIAFVDAAGVVATSFATGGIAYVRVEDQNFNDPARFDFVNVSLSSDVGDNLDIVLQETAKTSGVFSGFATLADSASPDSFNGLLETQAGGEITASHTGAGGSSVWTSAQIATTSIEVIDDNGLPTTEILESTSVRVRVTDIASNGDPFSAETVSISLDSFYAADAESLVLTETGVDTSVFEGSLPTLWNGPPPNDGIPGNGVLETVNSYLPLSLPDVVTARFGSLTASATTVGLRLFLIDAFGQETDVYAESDQIFVRVISHTINDPLFIDVADVTLKALTGGDVEQVLLQETGFDTAVFEGSIALGSGASSFDGLLDANSGETIEAERFAFSGTGPAVVDQALIGGSATFFIDADGQLTAEYLQASPAFVRVIAHSANASPVSVDQTSIQVVSEITGDVESLTLIETASDSGVFEGQVVVQFGSAQSAQPGNGYLETGEDFSTIDHRDTIVATYTDSFGQSVATARTVGSRIAFVDAAGVPTASYATGSTAYVWVEDQNFNDSARFDFVNVSLSSDVGDNLDIVLQETSKTSGTFFGFATLADNSSPDSFNGLLETQAGGEISASHTEAGGSSSWTSAQIAMTSIQLVDEAGLPTTEILESTVVRVRVTDVDSNGDAFSVETVSVSLDSFYAADAESLVLTETGADTSVFEGSLPTQWIEPTGNTGIPGNGILETENSYLPQNLPDVVTAHFGSITATATTVGLRLFLIDAFGRETDVYAESDQVFVRVISHTINDPVALDVADVTVKTLPGGDVEQVLLTETGFDTAVFEGSIALGSGSSSFDGLLDATSGDTIEAERFAFSGTGPAAVDQALIGGSTTFFIDESGQLTGEYLQGAPAFVRVIAHGANSSPASVEQTSVQVVSEITGDVESLTLTETAPDSGVFEGQIVVQFGSAQSAQPGDGFLETGEDFSTVDHRDTIVATYTDPFGQSIATARTVGSRIGFIDAAGNPVASYASGSTAYVRVEDQNFNDPANFDFVNVELSSDVGDNLGIVLQETAKTSGIFEGYATLADNASPDSFNGLLETQAGGEISASHTEAGGSSSWTSATITATAIEILGADGLPTAELLESSPIGVRVTSVADNTDPFSLDTLSVNLDVLYSADSESLVLTETGVDTHIFEGELPTQWIDPPTSAGLPGNGVLETENSYIPAFDPDVVTASFGSATATATTVGLRLVLIDNFGQETESYAAGDQVFVRVISHTVNDSGTVDAVDVTVTALTGGDVEQVLLTETGVDTAVFEGSIALGPGSATFDGLLDATSGETIEAERFAFSGTRPSAADRATIAGSAVFFLDAAGGLTSEYFQASAAFVRVIDHGVNQDSQAIEVTSLTLESEITGDNEFLTVTETGANSGVFEGTIDLQVGSAVPGDGQLTSGVAQSSPFDFDTLIATYVDGFGQSRATATTVGSAVAFIDGFGAEITVIDSGLTTYLRVEDHAANDPGQADFASVSLYSSSTGDMLDVNLLETGLDTGVFEGSFDLQDNAVADSFDGVLQAQVGDLVSASHSDAFGTNSSWVEATVVTPSNFPPAVAITSPADSSVFVSADVIAFTATASDPEEGDLAASLSWTSDLDGVIGSGGSFVANLSIGSHLIIASVTDAGGRTGQAEAFIQVNNTEPVTSITAPTDGTTFVAGTAVELTGTASDFEDGDLTAGMQWSSDVDGSLGSGGTIFTSTLSEGPHQISASVNDSGGLSGFASVNLTIEPANTAPTVTITTPADSSVFVGADMIAFSATADDLEDGDLAAGLVWTSDLDGVIGNGGSFLAELSLGTHMITAAVTDAGGLQASDAVSIQVNNTPPSVTISAPVESSSFNAGDAVSFAATADDFEEGDLTVNLGWSSDLDGAIGPSGGSFSLSTLSPGIHVITALVIDSGSLQGTDTVTITINEGPSVSITSPADGAEFNVGDSVTLTGTASDAVDGDLTSSLSWSSDVDGALGTGGSVSTSSLSSGNHVITASVTDAGGLEASATITLTINAGPSVSITSPADGAGFNVGDSVTLVGTASDAVDGDLTSSISWSSSVDGALGTGGSVSTSSLTAGSHVITAGVTDAGGLESSVTITLTINEGPSVSITSPADGAGFNVGDSVTLVGIASDGVDGDLTSSISWSSDVDGALGTGGSVSTSSLTAGSHVITASVTDAGGLESSATITLTINAGPSVSITSPADGAGFNVGDSVTLVGTASDAVDGDLTSSISWSSSVDGALGTGGSVSTSSLSSGSHVITASVTDAGSLEASATITLTINAGPSVSITAPGDGASFDAGDPISFVGTASDPEDGNLAASLVWTSSLDGAIGSGGTFSTSVLSSGVHVITASVTDSGGLQGSDGVTITVVANVAPSVSITSPGDGSTFDQGDSISFVGTASDPEDGNLAASLVWTSDLDGVIGSGGSFSTSALSLGVHTVTASVTDSGGLSGVAAITLTVKLPPVQIVLASIAGDDGWVRESNESSNVGGARNTTGAGSSALRPGDHKKDRQYKAIVSFDTSVIPAGATIVSADLRLLRGKVTGTNPFTTHGTCWVDVESGGFSGSTALQNSDFESSATAAQAASLSNAVSNGDWSEGSLNAAGLAAIDTAGTTQLRVYFDLDDNDDGGNDYMGYYSGNNSNASRHPQLVVVYQP